MEVITNQNTALKKSLGQFYTVENPFKLDVFYQWMEIIPLEEKEFLLEPFAGSNNIVNMIKDLGFKNKWKCFDISPGKNNAPEYPILQRDTISDFPKGFHVAITNPPYLARNSATRSGILFPETKYDDFYKLSLDVMLKNLNYVAAIIPESFINAKLFHNRIFAYISLPFKIFEDTECPVCLVLFIPEEKKKECHLTKDDFYIFSGNHNLGKYDSFKKSKPITASSINWKFNDLHGLIGIRCIDGTPGPSIEFMKGTCINDSRIKESSRSLTRVSGLPECFDLEEFLERCNRKLKRYRTLSSDIFLTSFKGLRKDYKYRRRLDFKTAKAIMNSVIRDMIIERENILLNGSPVNTQRLLQYKGKVLNKIQEGHNKAIIITDKNLLYLSPITPKN